MFPNPPSCWLNYCSLGGIWGFLVMMPGFVMENPPTTWKGLIATWLFESVCFLYTPTDPWPFFTTATAAANTMILQVQLLQVMNKTPSRLKRRTRCLHQSQVFQVLNETPRRSRTRASFWQHKWQKQKQRPWCSMHSWFMMFFLMHDLNFGLLSCTSQKHPVVEKMAGHRWKACGLWGGGHWSLSQRAAACSCQGKGPKERQCGGEWCGGWRYGEGAPQEEPGKSQGES